MGLNDDALTFNLFALAAVGDTGTGLAAAVVTVAGVMFPFAFTPFELEVTEVAADDGFVLPPLNGGID